MDMTIFQIESNKELPRPGSLLISAPFLLDFNFARSVVLMIEHNDEGSMGIVLNKNFSHIMSLNDVVPELASLPPIPLYKGGPIGRDTLFYLHTFDDLKDALKSCLLVKTVVDEDKIQELIYKGFISIEDIQPAVIEKSYTRLTIKEVK